MQRLWVTGYRSYELNVFGDRDPKITVIKYALKNYFVSLIEEGQLDWIITGANLGVEQWAVEVGLELGEKYPVRTSIMIPYEEFANRWNETNQAKYINLKEKVDFSDCLKVFYKGSIYFLHKGLLQSEKEPGMF